MTSLEVMESLLTWLTEQQLFISIILCSLLLLEKKALPDIGAKWSYGLWLLLPLAVLVNSLPNQFVVVESAVIQQYLVSTEQVNSVLESHNYLFFVWCIGCCLVLFNGFLSKQQKLIASSLHPMSDKHLPMKLPDNLRLYRSDVVSSPLLLGVFTPKLVLPSNYHEIYSESQLTMILEHELCHFKRKDNLFNSIAIILLSLFWFNPLIWVGYFSYRRLQEISCDSAVLQNKSKAQSVEYGKALLICAEQTTAQLCAYTHYGEKNTMLQRLTNLKQSKHTKPAAKLMAVLLSTSLLTGIAVANQPGEQGIKGAAKTEVHPVVRIEPKYPVHAAEKNIEGSVVLMFDIKPSGLVENVKVVKSKPEGVFNRVAKTALRQWEYKPSTHGAPNSLVQLDFAMGPDSPKAENLIERVKVTTH